MLQRIGQVVQTRFKSTKSWKPLSAEEYKKLLAESDDTREQRLPQWQKRDIAHKHRYGEWKPTKKLSRQQMADIRSLKEDHPLLKTVQLANHYNVSPEAVRRILRSKWVPNDAEETKIAERATKRKLGAVELRQKLVEHIEDEIQKLHRNKSVDVDSVRIASQHDSRRTRKNNSFNRNRDRDLLPHPQQHRNRRRPPSVVHNLEDLID